MSILDFRFFSFLFQQVEKKSSNFPTVACGTKPTEGRWYLCKLHAASRSDGAGNWCSAVVPLAHANQLSVARLQSAAGHWCKQRYRKCSDLSTFALYYASQSPFVCSPRDSDGDHLPLQTDSRRMQTSRWWQLDNRWHRNHIYTCSSPTLSTFKWCVRQSKWTWVRVGSQCDYFFLNL